uniref:Uncharacterized protein n=1 Tax=Romanomermis culicivorax TaxID=13658 RepID=A0A915IRS9_ROMCU
MDEDDTNYTLSKNLITRSTAEFGISCNLFGEEEKYTLRFERTVEDKFALKKSQQLKLTQLIRLSQAYFAELNSSVDLINLLDFIETIEIVLVVAFQTLKNAATD